MNLLEGYLNSFMKIVDASGKFDPESRDMIEKSFVTGAVSMYGRIDNTNIFHHINDENFELHEIEEEYKELFEKYMA